MATRAQKLAKAAAKAAAKTPTPAVAPALPAAPLSTEVLIVPPVGTPPGVLGVSPPVAPLSSVVVLDAAGDAYDEGDLPPEIVVGSQEVTREVSQGAIRPFLEFLTESEAAPAAVKPVPLADHPAIVAAQSYQTGHGVPSSGQQHYFTPAPPELRKPAAKA